MSIPQLSQERLEQMVHLACSYSQESITVIQPWYQRALAPLRQKSAGMTYGLGAVALTASCVGAFWLAPMMNSPQETTSSDISVSEYMMQDLLEDLTQPTLNPDLNFQA